MDDTLQLYFLCAHPSRTPASSVALTLRAVGGLTTQQIARAYLVQKRPHRAANLPERDHLLRQAARLNLCSPEPLTASAVRP